MAEQNDSNNSTTKGGNAAPSMDALMSAVTDGLAADATKTDDGSLPSTDGALTDTSSGASPDSTAQASPVKPDSTGTQATDNAKANEAAKTTDKSNAVPEEEELLSLEDLDNVINQADPLFSKYLKGIGSNEEIRKRMSEQFDLNFTLSDEESLWKDAKGWRGFVYRFFPIVTKLSFYWHKLKKTFLTIKFIQIDEVKKKLKSLGPLFVKTLKARLAASKVHLAKALETFKYMKPKKKLALVGVLFLFGGGCFVAYRAATKGLFPHSQEMFVGSLAEWAKEPIEYDPNKDTENFYDSAHSVKNIILLPRMVVNIKSSIHSGENPMAAIEYYVEGTASDVVVEIKDREVEITDLFHRNMEDMTYDQLNSTAGKLQLCDHLRKEINKILTKGKVRRVYIGTALLKP